MRLVDRPVRFDLHVHVGGEHRVDTVTYLPPLRSRQNSDVLAALAVSTDMITTDAPHAV